MTETTGSILAVDDSHDFRTLYELWFGSEYDIRTAADGCEALDRMTEAVDVVLLDREMPLKDGFETAREIQRRGYDAAIVMVSGVEPDTDLLHVPVDDYLQKPVQRDTVMTAIRHAQVRAECQPQYRRLLALETRLRIVESAASDPEITEYERIKTAVETGREKIEQKEDSPQISPDIGQSPRVVSPDT